MAILTMATPAMAIFTTATLTLQTAEDIDWLRDKTGVYGTEMSDEAASEFFEKQACASAMVEWCDGAAPRWCVLRLYSLRLYLLRLYLLWQIYVALYTKTTQLNNAVHILAHS